jgi:hypothetical protein
MLEELLDQVLLAQRHRLLRLGSLVLWDLANRRNWAREHLLGHLLVLVLVLAWEQEDQEQPLPRPLVNLALLALRTKPPKAHLEAPLQALLKPLRPLPLEGSPDLPLRGGLLLLLATIIAVPGPAFLAVAVSWLELGVRLDLAQQTRLSLQSLREVCLALLRRSRPATLLALPLLN